MKTPQYNGKVGVSVSMPVPTQLQLSKNRHRLQHLTNDAVEWFLKYGKKVKSFCASLLWWTTFNHLLFQSWKRSWEIKAKKYLELKKNLFWDWRKVKKKSFSTSMMIQNLLLILTRFRLLRNVSFAHIVLKYWISLRGMKGTWSALNVDIVSRKVFESPSKWIHSQSNSSLHRDWLFWLLWSHFGTWEKFVYLDVAWPMGGSGTSYLVS